MKYQHMSSTHKASDKHRPCKRKHIDVRHNFVNDTNHDGAGLLFSPANNADLYSGYSDIRSPHKQCKLTDRVRFCENDNEYSDRMCMDSVQVPENCSSEVTGNNVLCPADCVEMVQSNDQQHVTLTVAEQHSSDFEQLLYGVISENECSLVLSQKSDTADVAESVKKQAHKTDVCNSICDTSSDSSDVDMSHVAHQIGVNRQCSLAGNNAHHGTRCYLSTGALNNYSNQTAADSKCHFVNTSSVNSKTDSLQSTKKQNNDRKLETCASYCPSSTKSECYVRKPMQEQHHTLSSMSIDKPRYTLLRMVHGAMKTHADICEQTVAQTTENTSVVNRCLELNFSSIKNMSSSKKNDKKKTESRIVTTENSTSHRTKRHNEHLSPFVNKMCYSSDSLPASLHEMRGPTNTLGMLIANNSVRTTADVDHLDCNVQNTGNDQYYEDGCCSLPTCYSTFEKQVAVTEDCTEYKDSYSRPHKKRKKKKRHRVRDEMSTSAAEIQGTTVNKCSTPCVTDVGLSLSNDCSDRNISHVPSDVGGNIDMPKSEKLQKITEAENQSAVQNEEFTKSNKSKFTPRKNKPNKTRINEQSSHPDTLTDDCAKSKDLRKSSATYAMDFGLPPSIDCSKWNISHTESVPSGEDIVLPNSEKLQNNYEKNEKIVEIEKQCTVQNADCTESDSSEFTTHNNKSKKKKVNKHLSPSVSPGSKSVTAPLLLKCDTVDIPVHKTVVEEACTQTTGVLYHNSTTCSSNDSEDLSLQDNCYTALCENNLHKESEENDFEHLLLNVLATNKSSAECHEKNYSEKIDISSEKPGSEQSSSENTSDDDFSDVDMAKQCMPVNSQLSLSQTASASKKLVSCTAPLKNRKMRPRKCESETNKTQDCSTCSSDRSPSLLDSALLQRFHCDMQIPDQSEEVNGSDKLSPRLIDSAVSPDKLV